MDGRAQAQAERDEQGDDPGELQPVAKDTKQRARGDDRKDSRRQAGESDPDRAERKPDEGGDEDELDGQSAVELVDHAGAVARGDHRQSGHGDPVARVGLAHGVEPRVELIDDRHEPRQALVGHEAEDDDRVLVLCDEAPHEKERKHIDVLVERVDAGQPHLLGQPAPQRFQRPHVADPGLAFHDPVDVVDRRQRLRRIEAQPRGECDEHLDRIRAADLRVQPAARRQRLLLVGNLVGEAIARLEAGIDDGEGCDDRESPRG